MKSTTSFSPEVTTTPDLRQQTVDSLQTPYIEAIRYLPKELDRSGGVHPFISRLLTHAIQEQRAPITEEFKKNTTNLSTAVWLGRHLVAGCKQDVVIVDLGKSAALMEHRVDFVELLSNEKVGCIVAAEPETSATPDTQYQGAKQIMGNVGALNATLVLSTTTEHVEVVTNPVALNAEAEARYEAVASRTAALQAEAQGLC